MKKLVLSLIVVGFAVPAMADEDIRDLKSKPLTSKEWKAYRVSKALASEMGQETNPACVFTYDSEYSVTVRFYQPATSDSASTCTDPHYSIEVELDENDSVTTISVTDA
ncbi:MAG: hypothetical protein V4692_12885 [Bdellovibrionota bacterium]